MSELDTPNRDMSLLGPNFRTAIERAISDCAERGYPVKVNEGYRSQARQSWLYAQGRTRPGKKVTNAPTSLTSWHGYGLAIDVVHATKAYWPISKTDEGANLPWFKSVADVFAQYGCNWGGNFSNADPPHIQWGHCTPSPTQGVIDLMRQKGVQSVWAKLGAK